MALGNLLLQLQQNETQQNLQDALDKEDRRRKKSSNWMGAGGFLGGGLGLLGASALGLSPVGWGLAGIGGLAALGSGLGSKLGQQWAGGRESQATNLGQNVNLMTGEKKEFSDRIKDKYRRDVKDYSSDMNKAILTKAVQTGIKSAAFAGMNPDMWTKGSNFVRGRLGLPTTAVGDAVTEGVTQAATSNVTPPVTSTAPTVSPDAYIPPSSSAFTGPPAPQTGMEGLGPLSNVAYDKAVQNIPLSKGLGPYPVTANNSFIPDYMTNIAGSSFQSVPISPVNIGGTPINPVNTGAAFNNVGNFNQSFLDLLNMPRN